MQLWGAGGRCWWSSFWHQVCNKPWQTAEQHTTLNPAALIRSSGRRTCLRGTDLAVRNWTGQSHYCHPRQSSAPSPFGYAAQQPALTKEKLRQGDGATSLVQRQDKGNKPENVLHSKSYSSRERKTAQTMDRTGQEQSSRTTGARPRLSILFVNNSLL